MMNDKHETKEEQVTLEELRELIASLESRLGNGSTTV